MYTVGLCILILQIFIDNNILYTFVEKFVNVASDAIRMQFMSLLWGTVFNASEKSMTIMSKGVWQLS